jgi:hypothetical protein
MINSFGKVRLIYDRAALAEMTKTMTRAEIMERTGITRSHLAQLCTVMGVRPLRTRPQRLTESSTAQTESDKAPVNSQ